MKLQPWVISTGGPGKRAREWPPNQEVSVVGYLLRATEKVCGAVT